MVHFPKQELFSHLLSLVITYHYLLYVTPKQLAKYQNGLVTSAAWQWKKQEEKSMLKQHAFLFACPSVLAWQVGGSAQCKFGKLLLMHRILKSKQALRFWSQCVFFFLNGKPALLWFECSEKMLKFTTSFPQQHKEKVLLLLSKWEEKKNITNLLQSTK